MFGLLHIQSMALWRAGSTFEWLTELFHEASFHVTTQTGNEKLLTTEMETFLLNNLERRVGRNDKRADNKFKLARGIPPSLSLHYNL